MRVVDTSALIVWEVFHRAEEALAVVKSGAERILIQTFQK